MELNAPLMISRILIGAHIAVFPGSEMWMRWGVVPRREVEHRAAEPFPNLILRAADSISGTAFLMAPPICHVSG